LANTGNSASFTCTSEKKPVWYRGRTLQRITTYRDVVEDNLYKHTITLINLREEDSGVYYCLGKKDGKKFSASAKLYVGG